MLLELVSCLDLPDLGLSQERLTREDHPLTLELSALFRQDGKFHILKGRFLHGTS